MTTYTKFRGSIVKVVDGKKLVDAPYLDSNYEVFVFDEDGEFTYVEDGNDITVPVKAKCAMITFPTYSMPDRKFRYYYIEDPTIYNMWVEREEQRKKAENERKECSGDCVGCKLPDSAC